MLTEQQYRKIQNAALQLHFDANETAFLDREITFLRSKLFEVQYAELIGLSLLPLATDIPASAEKYAYKAWDRVGRAKIIGNGVNDLPRIDVIASEKNGSVVNVGASYGWNIDEMREAVRNNIPLSSQKANAAANAIATGVDELLATGKLTGPDNAVQDPTDIEGLLNNSDVDDNIQDPSNDPWDQGDDPADILADLNTMAAYIPANTNQRWIGDTMVLAPREYNIIATKAASDLTPGLTILQAFLQANPYVKNVTQWYRSTGAGAGGKNRAIVYKRDPMVLEGVVPQQFEQLPPEARGLEFIVHCKSRCGGVKIYQPAAVVYYDFATS